MKIYLKQLLVPPSKFSQIKTKKLKLKKKTQQQLKEAKAIIYLVW